MCFVFFLFFNFLFAVVLNTIQRIAPSWLQDYFNNEDGPVAGGTECPYGNGEKSPVKEQEPISSNGSESITWCLDYLIM